MLGKSGSYCWDMHLTESHCRNTVSNTSRMWLLRLSLSVWDTSGNIVNEQQPPGKDLSVEELDNLKEAVGVTEPPASSSWQINNWGSPAFQGRLTGCIELVTPTNPLHHKNCHIIPVFIKLWLKRMRRNYHSKSNRNQYSS